MTNKARGAYTYNYDWVLSTHEAIATDSSYMNYKEDTWRHWEGWEGCDEAMDGACLYRQELEEWAPLHAWVQMQVW